MPLRSAATLILVESLTFPRVALLYPEPEKGGRGKQGAVKEAKKLGGFQTSVCVKPARCCGSRASMRSRCATAARSSMMWRMSESETVLFVALMLALAAIVAG